MLMLPFFTTPSQPHAIAQMFLHPAGFRDWSDGGAHCGMICDASYRPSADALARDVTAARAFRWSTSSRRNR